MSGIGGTWNLDGSEIEPGLLDSMMHAIAHRGPDGADTWVNGNAGVGHRLLAVTPESRGERQPMELGGCVITFDGRIDNRHQLIEQLTPPNPHCPDAELVLRAYLRWGEGMPKRLLGDFAFGILDRVKDQWLCARDHFGVKVLHYAFNGRSFAFGSEIKQVLLVPGISRDLDMSQLGLFLSLKESSAHRTFYRDVSRLPAGHMLIVRRNGVRVERYWEPDFSNKVRLGSRPEYAEAFREIFGEAVRCRMRSASPVATMMSGGLDSTSVFATARELAGSGPKQAPELHTYSWVFPAIKEMDESHRINQVLRDGDRGSHFINGQDYWSMKEISRHRIVQDEPYTAPYEALLRQTLGEAASAGCRVMLTGQGGELTSVGIEYLLDMFSGLHWLSLSKEFRGASRRSKRRIVKGCIGKILPGQALSMLSNSEGEVYPPWIKPEFIDQTEASLENNAGEPVQRKLRSDHLQSLYSALVDTGRSPWVVWADQAGSENGIEFRHPFWDVRLVEFLGSIPPKEHYESQWDKAILRRAFDGQLPSDVCWQRGKSSLMPLFDLGAREKEADRLLGMCDDLRLSQRSVVDGDGFEKAYRAYIEGDATYRNYIWSTLATEEWLRQDQVSQSVSMKREAIGVQ